MPRAKLLHAITTQTSIASLWAMAEAEGEALISTETQSNVFRIRNALYKQRAKMRKTSGQVVGVEASHLDGYTVNYWLEDGKWWLRITASDMIEFTVYVPDEWEEAQGLPHFDTRLDEIPQAEPQLYCNECGHSFGDHEEWCTSYQEIPF